MSKINGILKIENKNSRENSVIFPTNDLAGSVDTTSVTQIRDLSLSNFSLAYIKPRVVVKQEEKYASIPAFDNTSTV